MAVRPGAGIHATVTGVLPCFVVRVKEVTPPAICQEAPEPGWPRPWNHHFRPLSNGKLCTVFTFVAACAAARDVRYQKLRLQGLDVDKPVGV